MNLRTSRCKTQISGFGKDERGTVAIMTAAAMAMILVVTAIAVDMASLYHTRRRLQGAVDLAAMAAANDLANASKAAAATLRANGIEDLSSLRVRLGHYEGDTAVAIDDRFHPDEMPYNAAQVHLDEPGRLYFARAFTKLAPRVAVEGTAATASLATFSVGSRLLAVRGGVANALLGSLLGTNISLTAMDYDSLLAADVEALSFLSALATRGHLTAVTYDDVLSSSASSGDILTAAASVLSAEGNDAAANVLIDIAGSAAAASVPLNSLIDLGPLGSLQLGDTSPGLKTSFSAMQLLSGTAALANGRHQVEVDLAGQVPGLLALKIDLSIGEPMQHSPWVAVGQQGSRLFTAQTRLRLLAEVGGSGALAGARIRLPLYLDLASAEARLAAVSCTGDSGQVTIAARPGVLEASIGEVSNPIDDWSSPPTINPASLVTTSLLKIRGEADVTMADLDETPLVFTQADIEARTIKRAETTDFTGSLVSSLLGRLSLDAQVAGLNLGLKQTATMALATQLAAVASPLDNVLASVLDTLGLHLGEADVRVDGVRCRPGVLTG